MFQFYKDNDIYSREGIGVAFNPTRFKERKTNLCCLIAVLAAE